MRIDSWKNWSLRVSPPGNITIRGAPALFAPLSAISEQFHRCPPPPLPEFCRHCSSKKEQNISECARVLLPFTKGALSSDSNTHTTQSTDTIGTYGIQVNNADDELINNNNNNSNNDTATAADKVGGAQWDWSFADAIVCICLRDRDDRLWESARQFHRVGLCSRVIYYRPTRPNKAKTQQLGILKASSYGCWESHRFVTRTARHSWNARNLLIFEDDVQFVDDFSPPKLDNIRQQMQQLPSDWDIFYLGHFPVFGYLNDWSPSTGLPQWRTWSFMLHAYMQNGAQMDRLIAHSYLDAQKQRWLYQCIDPEIEIDAWVMFTAKQYAAFPMVAYQSNSPTSNGKTSLLSHGSFNDWVIQQHAPYHRQIERTAMIGLPAMLVIILLVVVAIGIGYSCYCKHRHRVVCAHSHAAGVFSPITNDESADADLGVS